MLGDILLGEADQSPGDAAEKYNHTQLGRHRDAKSGSSSELGGNSSQEFVPRARLEPVS